MSDPTTAEQQPDLRAYGYAPGNYMCVCSDCNEQHTADKRAQRCKDCAIEVYAEATTAETPTMRYGFYVNGDLWAECSDENRAELIMDACAASFSDVASFDVMPLNETQD